MLDHSLVCRGKGKPGAGLPAFEDSDRGDCGLVPGTGICLNGCDKHSKHAFTDVIEKSSPLVIISCSSIRAPGCSSIRVAAPIGLLVAAPLGLLVLAMMNAWIIPMWSQ